MPVVREDSQERGSSVFSAMTLICVRTAMRQVKQDLGDTVLCTQCSVSSLEWMLVRTIG